MSQVIILCALLSQWMYSQPSENIPMTPRIVHERIGLFEENSVCIVAYRGTDSIEDLVNDITSQVFQTCNHETGFLREFEKSFEEIHGNNEILNYVRDESNCKNGLYLTGHSLGGSMASIARIEREHKVITFGEPNTCCWEMSIGQDTMSLLRVVNEYDMVPALPEPIHTKSLKHCGSTILSVPSNEILNGYEWPTLTDNHNVLDHRISEYVKHLRRYINNLRVKQY